MKAQRKGEDGEKIEHGIMNAGEHLFSIGQDFSGGGGRETAEHSGGARKKKRIPSSLKKGPEKTDGALKILEGEANLLGTSEKIAGELQWKSGAKLGEHRGGGGGRQRREMP